MRLLAPVAIAVLAGCGTPNVFVQSDPPGARVEIEEVVPDTEHGWSWRKRAPCELSLGMSLLRDEQPFDFRAWLDGHLVTGVLQGWGEDAVPMESAPGVTAGDGSWAGRVTLRRGTPLHVRVLLERR